MRAETHNHEAANNDVHNIDDLAGDASFSGATAQDKSTAPKRPKAPKVQPENIPQPIIDPAQ